MVKKFRQMVSLKKKRFQDGEFDLDLAYINKQIIAFGFPAEGRETVFRNPMDQCQKFFEKYHKDKYNVYNLCIEKERQYKAKRFQNRVYKYQWADHNAPPLEMIPEFCKHAADWLMADPENVVAVHCKAGKGRTGVLICCLLLYMKLFDDPEAAMKFYGEQRTFDGKGVTIPSQKRFIRYYFRTITEGVPPKHETALLQKVLLRHISTLGDDLHFGIQIESNGTVIIDKKKGDKGLAYFVGEDFVSLDLRTVPVSGNTKVSLFRPTKKRELLLHFWFHCHYVNNVLIMAKSEIDKAVSDKTHKVFPEDFTIEVYFENTGIYDDDNAKNSQPLSSPKAKTPAVDEQADVEVVQVSSGQQSEKNESSVSEVSNSDTKEEIVSVLDASLVPSVDSKAEPSVDSEDDDDDDDDDDYDEDDDDDDDDDDD